jgi:hypothetical protein
LTASRGVDRQRGLTVSGTADRQRDEGLMG